MTLVLAALLILTGAAGLMYQVVWFRVLGLVFGVTVQAASAVLAAFMAGLAAGSLGVGRLADRMANPLRSYGLMELFIGLSGLASLYGFEALQPLYRQLAPPLEGAPAALAAVRFALAFLIMLIPTTLMGATLPMAVRAAVLDTGGMSRSTSLLYAFNTLGAIGGAFSAGFYLIGLFGTAGTVAIAAGLNVLVGVACLALARRSTPKETEAAAERRVEGDPLPAPLARAVLVTYGISGGVALAYEVVWTRVLGLVLPQTVYAFALMLCAILSGIAAGSWLMERFIARRANWVLVYALFEAALGTLGILSATAMARAYGFEALVRSALRTERLLFADDLWFMTLFAFLTVFPAALFMGATFSVAARLYGQGHGAVGARVGTLYGANVLGAIAGSLLAGLALIPALGSQGTIWLLGAVNLALAVVILVVAQDAIRLATRSLAVGSAAVAGLVAALITPDM
ncbi:MAG TPA: fused MFS/spermidine synthase, partial [Chloroflexota bacterium]|nr:fused MFS/spermidine synthase [Chloroflexota bacterium]